MDQIVRQRVIRLVAVAMGIYLIYYLGWRATATLNRDALVFSLLLFAAEFQGAVNYFLFAFMTWDTDRRPRFELWPDERVDIFVPTYNEPLDILEATLVGCGAITYPHKTYVLDDGRRPEVAALAAQLGCLYLTRSDNEHAKAGNLNAALARTHGDFIVVLDADTVPQPDFLDKTLGYFVDDEVAIVQLPQEFYNLDSIQHAADDDERERWHEQTLFYRVIQPGKNRWNAAFWCGSPSVIRRTAIEEVGGVATESVTEDIHTTIRLHARGWKTVYHNETLAYGIAPQTVHAFAVQRLRWAQGTMQILRSRENPLFVPGLTIPQRLNYVASMFTYFDAFQKLIYLLTPALILLTGVLPLRVNGWEFVEHWLPYIMLSMLANIALGRGQFRYLRVEQYNLLKMFTFMWASTVLIWPRRLRFRVTPKEAGNEVAAAEWRQLMPHIGVLAVIGVAIAMGIVNLTREIDLDTSRRDILFISLFWALANAGILASGMAAVLHRMHHRRRYRFLAHLNAAVNDESGNSLVATTEDLSQDGVGLITACPDLRHGQQITVTLGLPSGFFTQSGVVMHSHVFKDGMRRVGVQFRPSEPEQRRPLIEYLFVTLPRSARTIEPATPASFGGVAAYQPMVTAHERPA